VNIISLILVVLKLLNFLANKAKLNEGAQIQIAKELQELHKKLGVNKKLFDEVDKMTKEQIDKELKL